LGRSQGGVSTQIHVRAAGRGKPLALLSTAGQRHEQTVFVPLRATGAVKRVGRGRPRIRPTRVGGAKGSSSTTLRRYWRWRGIGVLIPRRTDERHRGPFDRSAYRQRTVAERLVNRGKQVRRIATRYETRGVVYQGLRTLAAILLWL
jgi:transposase